MAGGGLQAMSQKSQQNPDFVAGMVFSLRYFFMMYRIVHTSLLHEFCGKTKRLDLLII
jgi:hypothetical protein